MLRMYDVQTRSHALSSLAAGLSLNRVSQQKGISRATLREWRDAPATWAAYTEARTTCCRCRGEPTLPEAASDYGFVLGLYLGDGYINPLGPRGVWILRISCARAISAVLPYNKVGRVAAPGCHTISAYSKHWPCLLPQHGPGVKHERPIVLETWQRELVSADPRPFLRGLFHSDGCRITNWTVQLVAGERKRYEYPRYSDLTPRRAADLRRCDHETPIVRRESARAVITDPIAVRVDSSASGQRCP
jgi:hypothetical protein